MTETYSPRRIIDTHQHVFWHGRDDEGLIADMDEHKIEYAWLLSWEIAPWEDNRKYHGVLNPTRMRTDGTHAGIVLEDLLIAKKRYPGRFIVGYCPHPLVGDAPARLEAAVNIHGIQVCGEWKFRILFDDPRCIELYRKAGKLNLPVVLHLDVPYLTDASGHNIYQADWYGGTVENLERALQACPETKFIGHAPGFWREISADAKTEPAQYPKGAVIAPGEIYRLFRTYPNLYADLSAGSGLGCLQRDTDLAESFLRQFEDRLLFARDYYGRDLYDFLQKLSLPAATFEKIFGGNAERLVPEISP